MFRSTSSCVTGVRTATRCTSCCTTPGGSSRRRCVDVGSRTRRSWGSSPRGGKIDDSRDTNDWGRVVTDDRLKELLRRIADTADQELSCSDCFDLIGGYVELEIDGREPAAALPALAQHLRQCGVCHEEYEVLRDLARLDAEKDRSDTR